MAKVSSSPKLLACLALFLLVVSAPSVMGRVRQPISEAAEVRAEVMEAVAKELAKEELMNAYYQQEIAASKNNPQQHLKQVVEQSQKPLKKCSLVGFPCEQDSDCCFGLTCRYVPAPFYNACSFI